MVLDRNTRTLRDEVLKEVRELTVGLPTGPEWTAETAKIAANQVAIDNIYPGTAGAFGESVAIGLGNVRMWLGAPTFNIRLFGAIGDGTLHPISERFGSLAEAQAVYPHVTAVTDSIDWAATQSAIDAAKAAGGGMVVVPKGNYRLNRFLTVDVYHISFYGYGQEVSRLVATTGDLFHLNASPYNLGWEDIGVAAISGHVFKVQEDLVHAKWNKVKVIQNSDAHSIVDVNSATAEYIDNRWDQCETYHTITATAPTFSLIGSSINSNHWSNMWVQYSGNYTWYIQTNHSAGGYAYTNIINDIVGEVLNGGAVRSLGGHSLEIANFDVWDTSAPISRHLFALELSSLGGTKYTKGSILSNVHRLGGTHVAGIYDIFIGSGGGNTPVMLIECGGPTPLTVRNAGHMTQLGGLLTHSDTSLLSRPDGAAPQFAGPVGLPRYTDATRPTAAAAGQGRAIFNTTTNIVNISTGSAWTNAIGTAV